MSAVFSPHPSVVQLFERERLVFIAGPCVIESRDFLLRHAERLVKIAERFSLPMIFKSSFDKANRTKLDSFRGPGIDEGLKLLDEVKRTFKIAILTDVHSREQCAAMKGVVDIIQIPAFLCRQTDLIAAAAETEIPINVKKGQFLAPQDMDYAIDKARAAGGKWISVTERGTTFGYRDLIVDMRSLMVMRGLGVPVVFDATHSIQRPGAENGTTGGNRLLAGPLARAAIAVGVDAVYAEVHEDPDRSLSDGPNSLTFEQLISLIEQTQNIDKLRRTFTPDPLVTS